MNACIITRDLIYDRASGNVFSRRQMPVLLGRLDNMPRGLTIELMEQFDQIADLVFEEFLASNIANDDLG